MSTDVATLDTDALGGTPRVVAFRGAEALCRPYLFEIFAQVEGGTASAGLEDAIGSRATLSLEREAGKPFIFHGILSAANLVRHQGEWGLYQLHLVPRLWQLGLTRHSRVFTNQTLPQIIETVLQDAGLPSNSYELRLTETYLPEELVVMYAESKLDFLHRWMEREGMVYFFEHDGGADKLVIADHPSAHRALADDPVPYRPSGGHDTSAGACFDEFAMLRSATIGQVRLTDRDYGRPMLDVSAAADVSSRGFGEQRLHAGRFFDPSAAQRYARIRAEALRARELTYHAVGTALHQSAGYLVELSDHGDEALNRRYLVREAHHFGNFLHGLEADDGMRRLIRPEYDDVYRVEVRAVDADRPFRLAEETTWPRVWGYESGTVDGEAESDYAQLDGDGRYHITFHFDESDLADGKRSTRVRMMQPHGGTTEGFHFPLRKGTEVIVAFLGGDPDRPVIAGVVPNAATPSPVT
ncbi:MAG: type VI secretion system tip protein TssI/VgrG [Polyangiaceae bacterium]